MQVLDLVVADQDHRVVEVVQALLNWLRLIQDRRVTKLDEIPIRKAVMRLRKAMKCFAGSSLGRPKFHRAEDMFAVIERFGGARHVTTDNFERAHQSLKAVMRRYAL